MSSQDEEKDINKILKEIDRFEGGLACDFMLICLVGGLFLYGFLM